MACVAVCAVAVAVCVCCVPPLYMRSVRRYEPLFCEVAQAEGVNASTLLAVANAESGFDPEARSKAGAKGIAQLMPATAEWVAKRAGLAYDEALLYDAEYNLTVAAKYLAYLGGKFEGEWVFAAYNAGENAVRAWLAEGISIEDIPYRETREYVRKVTLLEKRYRRILGG